MPKSVTSINPQFKQSLVSVFQRKDNTNNNSKLKKYILFDNDDKKDKDKDKKDNEKKVWIVWWDKNLDI